MKPYLIRVISAAAAVAFLVTPIINQVRAQEQVLNLRDADIRAFIDDVSMLTGRSFIVDPRVNGQVTVISREPIDVETVFAVFLSTRHTVAIATGEWPIRKIRHCDMMKLIL